jgi:hypothetical protein
MTYAAIVYFTATKPMLESRSRLTYAVLRVCPGSVLNVDVIKDAQPQWTYIRLTNNDESPPYRKRYSQFAFLEPMQVGPMRELVEFI